MAIIKPFKALKYSKEQFGDLKTVTSPPYDIISDKQVEKLIENNKYNIIGLERPLGENPYGEAANLLDKWKAEKVLKLDERPAIYIYEQEFNISGVVKKVKGFICDVKLEPFSEGVILPHEKTLSKAKEDRFNLMRSTFCNFSQIYSLYIDDDNKTFSKLENLSQSEPEVSFCDDDGVVHRLWSVYDSEAINSIVSDFEKRKLFIADGHHRYETALNFRNYCRTNGLSKVGDGCDYQMMMLVDIQNEGLVVFPTHRIIKNIDNFDPEYIIDSCKDMFDVEIKSDVTKIEENLKSMYEASKKSVAFYFGSDSWALFTLKSEKILDEYLSAVPKCIRDLDVTVLHSLILERLFGIDDENMSAQKNLSYTRCFDEAIDEVKLGKAQCSFIMNPTRVSEIAAVAELGEKMPQKSTYFYPKLITGLVMNDLKESLDKTV